VSRHELTRMPADLAVNTVKNLAGGTHELSAGTDEVMFIGAYRFTGEVTMDRSEPLGDVNSDTCGYYLITESDSCTPDKKHECAVLVLCPPLRVLLLVTRAASACEPSN
jgi:hypothetical protein